VRDEKRKEMKRGEEIKRLLGSSATFENRFGDGDFDGEGRLQLQQPAEGQRRRKTEIRRKRRETERGEEKGP
jgi:hypothetical protein